MSTLLFTEALHVALLRRARLLRTEDRAEARQRVLIVIGIVWLPLALFALVDRLARAEPFAYAFFTDIAAQARFLLAVPLLILADYVVLPRLEAMGRYFAHSSLLAPSQRPGFEALAASSRRLSGGTWPSAITCALVYCLVLAVAFLVPATDWALWQQSDAHFGLSLTGWWHLLVSMPVLLGLLSTWVWRWLLWVYVLWRLSRMGMVLLAAHPDRAAGIGFLAASPRVFIPVVFPVAVVVAATLAHTLLMTGSTAIGHEGIPLVSVAAVWLIFASPPLLFSRLLIAVHHIGVQEYGELSRRVGMAFEERWIGATKAIDADTLDRPDFSATTDLYGIASNALGMRMLLVDYPTLAALAIATIAPFVPLWLAAIPFRELVDHMVNLLV